MNTMQDLHDGIARMRAANAENEQLMRAIVAASFATASGIVLLAFALVLP